MKKRKNLISTIVLSAIILIIIFGISQARIEYGSRDRANACSCHGEDPGVVTIDTNLTDNVQDVGGTLHLVEGNVGAVRITIDGMGWDDVGTTANGTIAWTFWHLNDTDGIQIPQYIGTPPDWTYDDWSVATGTGNYHADWDVSPEGSETVGTFYKDFIINATGTPGFYYLYVRGIGTDATQIDAKTPEYLITINISAAFVPDPEPPEVTIHDPTPSAWVKGSVLINATVTDAITGVDSVWAEVTDYGPTNDTVPMSLNAGFYTGNWNSTSRTDGPYTIKVKATDNNANLNDTETVAVNNDNNPPSILITSVLPNPSNGLTIITATNSSSDIDANGILANVSTPGGWRYPTMIYQGANTWTGNFTVTADGNYRVRINATDYSGQTGYAGPRDIVGDVTAPSITLVSVLPSLSNGLTTITATNASTDIDANGILANVSTPGGGWLYPTMTYIGANTWTGTFTVTADGTYTVQLNATDYAGNTGYAGPTSITGDVTAPSITLVSVLPSLSNGVTTITATNASSDIDANGILANVSTPSGGWLYPTMTYVGGNTWTGTFTVTADGTYTVRLNATDNAGNTGYSIAQAITGDVSAPSITLVSVLPSPSNGITTITATNASTDIDANGIIANVSTPGGGWLYPTMTYVGGNTWTGTFTVTADGTYTVRINATDIVGNVGYAGPINIRGDVTAPTITLTSVTPNPSKGLTTIQATNASTDIDANGILANISTPSGGWLYVSLTYQGANTWAGTFTVTQDGDYTVRINATDKAGNTGYSGPSTITGDLTAPSITITNVTPNPSNGLTTITATNASADINVNGILANVSTPGGGWLYPTMTYQGANTWTGTFTVTANGVYTVRINATDHAGNTGYAGSSSITGDVSAPTISILSISPNPSNGLTTITAENLSSDIDGNGIMASVSIPGGGWLYPTMTYIGANTWTGTFTVTANGIYSVRINATDYAGNTGNAGPQSITGDVSAPNIALLSVLPNPSNGLVTITATNASTDIDMNGIMANVSTPGGGWLYPTLNYIGANTWQGTFTVTADGAYTVRINATDKATNTGYAGPTTITGDISAPSISITSVTPNPSNGVTTITATNTSTDIDANGILANISTPSGGWIYRSLSYVGGNTWTATFTVTQNGIYSVRINATDIAGNVGYAGPSTITGDVSAPTIAIISITPNPSNGITTITAENLSADIDGNGILANVSIPGGGWLYPTMTYQGGVTWTGNFTVTISGTYTVRINATDIAGNTAYAGPQNIIGDVAVPTITILNPGSDGQQLGGAVISLSGSASGTGSNIQSIYINDSRWGISQQPQTNPSGTPSGAWVFNNNTVIPNGDYWVEINITDAAGNTNSAIRNFLVVSGDVNPPVMTITLINPNPTNGFTEITVTSNEALIGAPQINITAPNSSVYYPTMYLIGALTWRTNFTVFSTGNYLVQVNGTDAALNTGYANDTIKGDITAPSITLVSVLPVLSNGLTTITATNASTDIDANGILANVSTPSSIWIYVSLSYIGGNTWTGTFPVTADGTYTVRINATDTAGNTGYSGPISIIGDVTLPTILLNSVTPNPSNGITTITIVNTTSDIDGSGILVNVSRPGGGWLYPTMTYIGGNLWTGTFTVTLDGTYTVRANATDFAGNIANAGPMSIRGDVTAPTISIISVLPNPSKGLTTITAQNSSRDIDANGILANISTPSGGWLYVSLSYIGANNWQGTFTVTEDGTYTVRLNATDYAGNTGYAGPQTITGDVTGPNITLVSVLPDPSNGPTVITATNASNDIDVNGILANVSTPSAGWIYVSLTYRGGNIWNGTFVVTENGLYTVRLNATDLLGNVGYAGPQSITGDVSGPSISLISVLPNPSNGLTTITASNATSDIDANGILANVSTPGGGWLYPTMNYVGGDTWTGNFTVTQNGAYTVRINASDTTGTPSYAGPITITGDIVAPSITLVSVLPVLSKGLTTITATNASTDIDANGILANVSTPSGAWLYISMNYIGFNNWQGTFTVTEDGNYTVRLNASDKAGNTGYAGPQSITGDVTAPSIVLVSVLPTLSNGVTTITATNASSDINANGILANISTPSGGWIYRSLSYGGGNTWTATFTVTQDGSYTVRINATDIVGNTGYSGPVSIAGDVLAPVISIISLVPNPSNGITTITATNTSTDIDANGLLANVSIPGGGWLYPTMNYIGGNTWTGTFTVTTDGTYTVRINATDLAGNIGYAGPTSIRGDVTAPSITLVSILPTLSNGIVTITATNGSTDIDANGILANVSTPGGSWLYPTLNYIGANTWQGTFSVTEDGTYTVGLNATDKAGNTGYAGPQSITGDVTSPSILLVSVLPTLSNGVTTITATNASSDINGNGILANVSTPSGGWLYPTMTYTGSNTWTGTFTVTQDGSYTVRINATDFAGNTGYSGPISITGDISAPGISITSVLPNPSNGITTITVTNTTSDIDGIGILANVSTPSGGWLYPTLSYIGGNTWTGTFTVTANGVYSVRINASDVISNIAYDGPITIVGDISPPSIIVNAPVASNTYNGTITIRASIIDAETAVDGLSVYAIVTGPVAYTSAPITLSFSAGQYRGSWDSTTGTDGDGDYTVVVYANDTAGNQQTSIGITFTVDNTESNVVAGVDSIITYSPTSGFSVTVTINANISGNLIIESIETVPALPEGLSAIGMFLNITFVPDKPSLTLGINSATISIELTLEFLAELGNIDLSSIQIYHFNELTGEWEALATTVVNDSLVATFTSLSFFGVFVVTPISDTTLIILVGALVALGVILSFSPEIFQAIKKKGTPIQQQQKQMIKRKELIKKKPKYLANKK